MKFQYRDIKDNIVQITTSDERWYAREEKKDGQVIKRDFVPSVTWIAGHYPKGIGFYKWLADKGWNEAEAIKSSAGDKGSKIHSAIEQLLNGETVKINDKFLNPSTEELEELTAEEYEAIMSFVGWHNEAQPKVLKTEFNVFGEHFAGTVDFLCEIENNEGKMERWIIDFKTSQYVWPEHKIQLSAYKHLVDLEEEQEHKIAILQVGYNRNKKKFKFTEIEDCYDLFGAAYQIWRHESSNQQPSQKDFPIELTLNLKNNAESN
jgi:hypothetical protein